MMRNVCPDSCSRRSVEYLSTRTIAAADDVTLFFDPEQFTKRTGAAAYLGTLGHSVSRMKKNMSLLAAVFLLAFLSGSSLVSAQSVFEVDREGNIRANIVNAPLRDVLYSFCSRFNLEIKGTAPTSDTISLAITKGSVDETLKRLLRGYNYVLMRDTTARRSSVIIMGKTEGSKYADVPRPARAAPEVIPAPMPPPPASRGLTSAPAPAAGPVHDTVRHPKATTPGEQRHHAEETPSPLTASARAANRQIPAVPPSPPSVPGFEMPPVPPTLEEARIANPTVAAVGIANPETGVQRAPQSTAETSSGRTPIETPPQIPAGANQLQPNPKPDLKDLTPPPIPSQ